MGWTGHQVQVLSGLRIPLISLPLTSSPRFRAPAHSPGYPGSLFHNLLHVMHLLEPYRVFVRLCASLSGVKLSCAFVVCSPSMLEVARESGAEGDLCLADMGQGFGFRTGMFDGVIR